MKNKVSELVKYLEQVQRRYPELHVLIGQTITCISDQKATITELRALCAARGGQLINADRCIAALKASDD